MNNFAMFCLGFVAGVIITVISLAIVHKVKKDDDF